MNEGPELAESSSWYVRKPEGEEHNIIFGVCLPDEEVLCDIVDIGAPHPFLVERENLGRTVNNGETVSCPCETLSPPTSSSSQFQHRALGAKRRESVVYDGHLALPLEQLFAAPVIPTTSLPPFVILGRSRPVVRTLLGEQVIVLHVRSVAAWRVLQTLASFTSTPANWTGPFNRRTYASGAERPSSASHLRQRREPRATPGIGHPNIPAEPPCTAVPGRHADGPARRRRQSYRRARRRIAPICRDLLGRPIGVPRIDQSVLEQIRPSGAASPSACFAQTKQSSRGTSTMVGLSGACPGNGRRCRVQPLRRIA